MITTIVVLAALVLVGQVLLSRMRGRPVDPRRLYVLPVVLCAIGLLQVAGSAGRGLPPLDLGLVGLGVVASVALGVARGITVDVHKRDGVTWMRYRHSTLALWGATVAVRLAVAALAGLAGAPAAARGPAILLSVGLTLLAEGVVIGRRAYPPVPARWQAGSRRQHAATR